jgi:hypothetical protein
MNLLLGQVRHQFSTKIAKQRYTTRTNKSHIALDNFLNHNAKAVFTTIYIILLSQILTLMMFVKRSTAAW